MKVALLIILCFCEANLNIDVFYSHHSNLNLVQYVTDKLIQEYKTVSIYLSDIDDCKEIHECMHFPSLLIDITSSLTNHEQIRRSSMINDFLHINLSKPRDDYGNYEFFTHISPYFHSQSLKSLTTHLGLKPLIIIGKFLSEIVAHTKSD